ncbi:hypothetical protein E5082_18255 [Streptomyces griseoluteus]|uniref:Uncharacterized protein n=1 Tax=Streptomyces griseoluteus TaxID=29306 RepID=A0A4Z1DHM9_STRGP|nr:DUF6069 family protein [Streptomyces griseoluteus]TGN82365.1 hypothetical protein E5082_18255 [Streptomyces griseoluteus]GHF10022.1 hypothetical protein GCM10017776_29650 [Streptomyces griseoluteus]
MTADNRSAGRVPAGTRVRNRLIALAVAEAVAAATWLIGNAAGAELTVNQNGVTEITLAGALVTTLFAGLVGWGLLAVLERFTQRARTAWTYVAGAVLLLSLFPTILADATTGTRLTLTVMHLMVGAVLIPSFRRSARGT